VKRDKSKKPVLLLLEVRGNVCRQQVRWRRRGQRQRKKTKCVFIPKAK
jgi:hypothetical protein